MYPMHVSRMQSVTLANLDVSNQGGSGISLYGSNNILRNVSGSGLGCKGASVSGGDVSTLSPGNNTAIGCSFTKYARFCRTYQAGIAWGGVGNSFIGNTVRGVCCCITEFLLSNKSDVV